MYNVKLELFEGPFDLLVYLIEKSRMNIYDINVAEITEQYIEYMQHMQELDVNLSSEFLVLAATLILLKSKMLLPGCDAEDDESAGGEQEDPRTPLVERLLEYRRFKKAAVLLGDMWDRCEGMYPRPQEDLSIYQPEDRNADVNVDANEFAAAFLDFLERRQRIEEVRHRYSQIRDDRMSLEDKINHLMNVVLRGGRTVFSDLMQGGDTYDIVLTFLSVLELARLGQVSVSQDVNCGEIYVNAVNRTDARVQADPANQTNADGLEKAANQEGGLHASGGSFKEN